MTQRFLGELMERIGHHNTSVSVRAGSSRVFVGVDFSHRFAGQDILITTEDARRMAKALFDVADEVDAEMEADQ